MIWRSCFTDSGAELTITFYCKMSPFDCKNIPLDPRNLWCFYFVNSSNSLSMGHLHQYIRPHRPKQVCILSQWFLNLRPNQARAALAAQTWFGRRDSRTTDFRLGLLVLVRIRMTSCGQLWTYLIDWFIWQENLSLECRGLNPTQKKNSQDQKSTVRHCLCHSP